MSSEIKRIQFNTVKEAKTYAKKQGYSFKSEANYIDKRDGYGYAYAYNNFDHTAVLQVYKDGIYLELYPYYCSG